MTTINVSCGAAFVTGELGEVLIGRPMAGASRGDRQKIRLTLTVTGEDAREQVQALLAAVGVEPVPMSNRAALVLALGLMEAEQRRLAVDVVAAQHGCEESEINARRHEELAQAIYLVREMLIGDQV